MPRPPESLQTLLDTGSTQHSAKQIRDYLSYHGLDLAALRQDTRCGLSSGRFARWRFWWQATSPRRRRLRQLAWHGATGELQKQKTSALPQLN
jgi:hypothetical protein